MAELILCPHPGCREDTEHTGLIKGAEKGTKDRPRQAQHRRRRLVRLMGRPRGGTQCSYVDPVDGKELLSCHRHGRIYRHPDGTLEDPHTGETWSPEAQDG